MGGLVLAHFTTFCRNMRGRQACKGDSCGVVGRFPSTSLPESTFLFSLKLPLFCHDFERTNGSFSSPSPLLSLSIAQPESDHSMDRFLLFGMITVAATTSSLPL